MTPDRPRIKVPSLLLVGVFLVLAPTRAVQAGESFHVLLFASQRIPNNPNYSHTFATFIRATDPGDGPCAGGPGVTLEVHTISWLPRNTRVRTHGLLPECGHNFGLDETLRLVLATKQRVFLWGPYRIEPELYYRAVRHVAELEGGGVRYKANDMGHRSDRVSNCIHAVSSIVDRRRLRVASPGWGQVASYAVLRRMKGWLINPEQHDDWLVLTLGLDAYPISYRNFRPPASGTVLGPAFRLLGSERDLQPTYGPPPRS
jgi:hypothetical protein